MASSTTISGLEQGRDNRIYAANLPLLRRALPCSFIFHELHTCCHSLGTLLTLFGCFYKESSVLHGRVEPKTTERRRNRTSQVFAAWLKMSRNVRAGILVFWSRTQNPCVPEGHRSWHPPKAAKQVVFGQAQPKGLRERCRRQPLHFPGMY